PDLGVHRGQEPWMLDRYKTPVIPLSGRVLEGSGVLTRPASLASSDSVLALIDRGADKQAIILSKRTGRVLLEFGRKGSGPGEFRGPSSIEVDPRSTRTFWVLDAQLRRLTRTKLGQRSFSPKSIDAMVQPLNETYLELRPLSGNRFVGSGVFTNNSRLSIVDSNGMVTSRVGSLPKRPEGVPPSVWQEAQRVHMAVSSSGQRIAVGTRFADRIELFDANGVRLGETQRHFSFEPEFKVGHFSIASGTKGPALAQGDKIRYGYVGLAATDQLIFAVFSGKVRERFRDSGQFGQYLHVFDWAGRPVAVYHLGYGLLAIAVEPDGSRLYGIRHDPEPAVLVYDMPRKK
ncbi:BF3164 family lipoprotein, partial [Gemmatimonas sp. UBA7669]|uniref:BF3164 family lipoprotein n=1 Tax=Gemmatimonas sp. UBA7669 TaxID=1946568 RepID=UPI0025BB094B